MILSVYPLIIMHTNGEIETRRMSIGRQTFRRRRRSTKVLSVETSWRSFWRRTRPTEGGSILSDTKMKVVRRKKRRKFRHRRRQMSIRLFFLPTFWCYDISYSDKQILVNLLEFELSIKRAQISATDLIIVVTVSNTYKMI